MMKFSPLFWILLFAKQNNAAVSLDRLQESVHPNDALENIVDNKTPGKDRFSSGYPVSEQKTVVCPGETAENLYGENVVLGQRTRFVVKNDASEPVIVSFVEQDGTEYSAAHYGITPANLDPDAFLGPGDAKVFGVTEGHVFHVRDSVTGELLLQHRAGIVSINNKFNQELDCSGPEVDVFSQDTPRVMRKFPGWQPAQVEQFDQEVPMDIGFQNKVLSSDGKQCPVNLYFVKKAQKGHRKPNYMEKFKFHLGANNRLVGDQIWDAAMKHEATFLGHEFVVRLATNDNIVVDHFAIAPEKVVDCSNRKKEAVKSTTQTNAIVIPVGRSEDIDSSLETNQTHLEQFINLYNTTEAGRSLYFKLLSA